MKKKDTLARTSGFRRLAIGTAAVSLLLIAVGGAVRATDSGLACPTWPGCFSAGDFLPPADLNVWLEHTHRLIAGVVGVLVAVQAGWAVARYRGRPWIVWPAVVAAVGVLAQAALGALVVLHLLRAELVTAHLGMGMLVLACLILIAAHAGPPPAHDGDPRFARRAAAVTALAFVQILVGGHVTGIGSGLAFSRPGTPLWGALGITPLETAGQAFNLGHRILAVVLAAAVMYLVALSRRTGQTGWTLRLPMLAAGLVVLQVLLGVANLVSRLSFVTVIPHLVVASWIWASLCSTTVLAYRASSRPQLQQPRRGSRPEPVGSR